MTLLLGPVASHVYGNEERATNGVELVTFILLDQIS